MAASAHRSFSFSGISALALGVTLGTACAGTDGVTIGGAGPDAGSVVAPEGSVAPSVATELPTAMADPGSATADAGAADFDVPVKPVAPAPGVPPPSVTPPPAGDPLEILRESCVATVNQYRQAVGRAPLRRWNAAEACVDAQAHIDAYYQSSHRSFRQCTELAQNECPNWPGQTGAQAVGTCLQAMWSGGPSGSHFANMVSTRWTHVACGFHQAANGRWWVAQNFR